MSPCRSRVPRPHNAIAIKTWLLDATINPKGTTHLRGKRIDAKQAMHNQFLDSTQIPRSKHCHIRGIPSLRAMEGNVLEETFDSLIESLAHHGPVLARVKVNYPTIWTLVTLHVLTTKRIRECFQRKVCDSFWCLQPRHRDYLYWTPPTLM